MDISKKVIMLSLIAAASFWTSCDDSSNRKKALETGEHHHEHMRSVYACPTHPEITGKPGEKCSKCGMELQAVSEKVESQYQLELTTSPENIQAGKPSTLIIAIKRDDKNVPLEFSHEKKLHVILVNDPLTWFKHIHPEEQKDGSLTVTDILPQGGKYLLFADFKPDGGKQTVKKAIIESEGKSGVDSGSTTPKLVSSAGDYQVTLENGNQLKTNRTESLKFSIRKGGRNLYQKDMEQYLGAIAHVVMIRRQDKDYLHIHPIAGKDYAIIGETFISKPGVYRMWVQFQIRGEVYTADFTVDVKSQE